MKPKKALKKLKRVEVLLTDVIEQVPDGKRGLGELLTTAKASVLRAQKTVNAQRSAKPAKKKPQASAETSTRRRSAAKRKKVSAAELPLTETA